MTTISNGCFEVVFGGSCPPYSLLVVPCRKHAVDRDKPNNSRNEPSPTDAWHPMTPSCVFHAMRNRETPQRSLRCQSLLVSGVRGHQLTQFQCLQSQRDGISHTIGLAPVGGEVTHGVSVTEAVTRNVRGDSCTKTPYISATRLQASIISILQRASV